MAESALVEAVKAEFSPDPWLGDPDPVTIEAVVELVREMAAVSKARRAELAEEPWRGKLAARHFNHASRHTIEALFGSVSRVSEHGSIRLDTETGRPEAAHAALRLAFGLYRQRHP